MIGEPSPAAPSPAPEPLAWREGPPPLTPRARCLLGWCEVADGCRYPFMVDQEGRGWDIGRGFRLYASDFVYHITVPERLAV